MSARVEQLLSLVHFCEHRGDRSYDNQDASHLMMPYASLVASYDRPFLAAATREVLTAHITHQAAKEAA